MSAPGEGREHQCTSFRLVRKSGSVRGAKRSTYEKFRERYQVVTSDHHPGEENHAAADAGQRIGGLTKVFDQRDPSRRSLELP